MAEPLPTTAPREAHTADHRAAYRPAVVPIAVYFGAAIQNAETVLIEVAPWVYLGVAMALLGLTQWIQRRRRVTWSWSTAIIAGFVISAVALLCASL